MIILKMLSHLIAEVIGTAVLNTVVCITLDAEWSNNLRDFYSPWAVSVALLSALILTGLVSGGHLNPAITTGVILKTLIDKQLNKSLLIKYLCYIPAQLIGGWLGALLAFTMTNQTNFIDIGDESSEGAAFLAELVFSFLLVSAAVMSGYVTKNKIIYASTVAGTLFTAASTIGSLSGCCINPAIGITANTVALHSHEEACDHLWIYIIAPTLGGALSSVLYLILKRDLENMQAVKEQDDL
jgi:glycerol uptake facilitator-like aquaporin